MKGFGMLVVFAVVYLLIVIILQAEDAASAIVRAEPKDQNASSNPFADMFQVTDPATKTMMEAIYGSYSGDDQCRRKSFCIMGNYLKDMPGQNFVFMLLGNYIPPEYSIFYDIFRNSALYGQNCNVYVCIPPPPTPSNPTTSTPATSSTTPRSSQPR